MESCDGYQGGVWRYGMVRQLTGSLTVNGDNVKVIREVLELLGYGRLSVDREV